MKDTDIIGQKIKEIRDQTPEEMEGESWDSPAKVIVLENGVLLYPSCDYEGNGAGALFTQFNEEFGAI